MKLIKLILYFLLLPATIFPGSGPGDKSIKNFPRPRIKFNPKYYICYQASETMKIDGQIDEAAWQLVDWTENFVDIEGELKPSPKFRTRAKMLWDLQYLYFAAELEEPDIWAKLTKRDTVVYYDNDFEVFIDPDGDTHEYYEFEMNAFGTEWDLFLVKPYRDGGPAINSWDIQGLKTAVHVNGTINQPGDKDKSWTLEIAIPWEVLKECAHKPSPPNNGDQWRINFSRVEWQVEVKNGKYKKSINPETGNHFPENNWVWSPQGLINMHYPEMWGFVQFSDKIAGTTGEVFIDNPGEKIKWVLRQIYYGQKNHQLKFGTFSDNLHQLGFESDEITKKIQIKYTWNRFEALWQESGKRWFINDLGRTWKEAVGPH